MDTKTAVRDLDTAGLRLVTIRDSLLILNLQEDITTETHDYLSNLCISVLHLVNELQDDLEGAIE